MNLTVNQQRLLQRFPWEQLIPLVIQLVGEVRRNGLFSEKAIDLIIQIVQMVISSLQAERMTAADWRDIWDMIQKFLPIIIELIGGLQSDRPARNFCDSAPRR